MSAAFSSMFTCGTDSTLDDTCFGSPHFVTSGSFEVVSHEHRRVGLSTVLLFYTKFLTFSPHLIVELCHWNPGIS